VNGQLIAVRTGVNVNAFQKFSPNTKKEKNVPNFDSEILQFDA
jgi:hypothetical protein